MALNSFALIDGNDRGRTFADDADLMSEASANIQAQFQRLDVDKGGTLDLDEFLAFTPQKDVLRRDFLLYDFNGDQRLSLGEFSAVQGVTEDWLRGSVPDPFDRLLEDAVAALDESYNQWQKRPGELVNAHLFVANFIGSISPEGKRFVTGRILRQADRDSDGRLSRTEARGFMEYQLGIRWHDGAQLRERTGRLVRLGAFIEADLNRNDVLTPSEFAKGSFGDDPGHSFNSMDRDSDGRVSLREYSHYRSASSFFDPIAWFRMADLDLDARLSRSEIAVLVGEEKRHLVSTMVPAFDLDGDGFLDVQEYRLSMLANVNYPWHRQPRDTNRDGYLSYDEFVFMELDLFQLQRRYYYHRLDRNQDGKLSVDEFEFRTDKPNAIYLHNGEERRLVYQDTAFPQLGNLSVSDDGRKILFERRRAIGSRESEIALTDFGGSEPISVCDGSHPSWGSDDAQFVCERLTASGKQIWVMSTDGRSGRPIAEGTAPKWSPDGSRIAFLQENGVRIFDVESGKTHAILRRHEHAYRDLGTRIVWSHESDNVAVIGRGDDVCDLISLDVQTSNSYEQCSPIDLFDKLSPGVTLMMWSIDGIVLGLDTRRNSQPAFGASQADDKPYAIVVNPARDADRWRRWSNIDHVGALISACRIPTTPWYTTIVDF